LPKKRKITAMLSRPMVIPDAAFKLLAQEFIEWYEREGYKLDKARQDKAKETSEKQPSE